MDSIKEFLLQIEDSTSDFLLKVEGSKQELKNVEGLSRNSFQNSTELGTLDILLKK